MNGNNILYNIIFIIIIIVIGIFAIRLLPYILLLWFIYYLYTTLIKPLIYKVKSKKGDNFQDRNSNYKNSNTNEDTYINTSKSVKDDNFFKKDHDVIDVDYDEKIK